jgi:hypothetical protein
MQRNPGFRQTLIVYQRRLLDREDMLWDQIDDRLFLKILA